MDAKESAGSSCSGVSLGTRADLEAACEDYVSGNRTIEFWGADYDGDEWRVHLGHRDDCEVTS